MPARPRPRPRRSIAQRLRSLLWLALWGAVLWWGGGWLWQQPLMDRPRMLWQITRMDPPTALPVPACRPSTRASPASSPTTPKPS